jgi:hypothetical protein
MNTLKTVYGKLFKEETTNLASHEVNLALRDDIISSFQKFLAQKDTAKKILSKTENAIIDAYNNYAAISGFGNGTLKDVDVLKAKAKELGLELDPDVQKIETIIKSQIKSFTNNSKAIMELAKSISNYRTSL